MSNRPKPFQYPSTKGDNNPSSKLNDNAVKHIKVRLTIGDSVKDIANDYNVVLNTIYDIRKDKTWRHVVITGEDIESFLSITNKSLDKDE